MPQGRQFNQLVLHRTEEVGGSGADADSYFNRLAQHASGLRFSAIGKVLSPHLAARFGGTKGVDYVLAVKVVAMGGTNSPSVAQDCHMGILASQGVKLEHFMSYEKALDTTTDMTGIMYDDLISVLRFIPSERTLHAGPDRELLARAFRGYAVAEVPTSPAKCFGFCADINKPEATRASTFTAWGTHIQSRPGVSSALPDKLVSLQVCTMRSLCLPYVTSTYLRRL